jgi:hypothetical protein
MSDERIKAEIEDILMDIRRYTQKVDKTSSTALRTYCAKVQELLDRLNNIAKVMDYLD